MYVYVCMYIYIYIYIYTQDLWSEKRPPPTPLVYDQAVQKDRRELARGEGVVYRYIYIYIYILSI